VISDQWSVASKNYVGWALPTNSFKLLAAPLACLAGLFLAAWLTAIPALAWEAATPDLAQRLGCFACHTNGPGHRAAPLNGVGARLSRDQLKIALTQPRQLHPGVKMPSYAYLPEAERQTLVDFLTSLK
jgi:hypothetical protein